MWVCVGCDMMVSILLAHAVQLRSFIWHNYKKSMIIACDVLSEQNIPENVVTLLHNFVVLYDLNFYVISHFNIYFFVNWKTKKTIFTKQLFSANKRPDLVVCNRNAIHRVRCVFSKVVQQFSQNFRIVQGCNRTFTIFHRRIFYEWFQSLSSFESSLQFCYTFDLLWHFHSLWQHLSRIP